MPARLVSPMARAFFLTVKDGLRFLSSSTQGLPDQRAASDLPGGGFTAARKRTILPSEPDCRESLPAFRGSESVLRQAAWTWTPALSLVRLPLQYEETLENRKHVPTQPYRNAVLPNVYLRTRPACPTKRPQEPRMPAAHPLPQTLGELRASKLFSPAQLNTRSIKDEMRSNLIARLQARETIFPGIVGYEDTVVPQIVNAVLSRQNFILLGLRGQAKSRILRALTALLDEQLPYIAGCEIRDNPYQPLCKRCRDLIADRGDSTPIAYLSRDDRYVEKLATPDVTVADLIGDLDPIKAARGGDGSFQRIDHALRPAAARQSRHFRGERTARPGRQDPGGAFQHHAGRRCADQRLPGAPGARRCPGVQRQSGRLHGSRQDRDSAQRPHRLGDSHPLSRDARRRHRHHHAGGMV